MKTAAKQLRRSIVIADIALILLGFLLIAFPDQSAALICRIIGILLCVMGVIRAIVYFAGERHIVLGSFALVQGAALIGFGLLFAIHPEQLASILILALAISLIVSGVMKLQYAIDFARLHIRIWWLQLLSAAALIVLGIVALANPFETASALMIYTGISIACGAIWDLASILWLGKQIDKAANLLKDRGAQADAIDVDYEDVN